MSIGTFVWSDQPFISAEWDGSNLAEVEVVVAGTAELSAVSGLLTLTIPDPDDPEAEPEIAVARVGSRVCRDEWGPFVAAERMTRRWMRQAS